MFFQCLQCELGEGDINYFSTGDRACFSMDFMSFTLNVKNKIAKQLEHILKKSNL